MSRKILGNFKTGRVFVVSAPAGTGKSTLVKMLVDEFPDAVAQSCSCTTRLPRQGELAAHHYHFISKEEFQQKIGTRDFLEYAEVYGNFYGTPKDEVEALISSGKHVILVIDTQGAMELKKKIPATFIFISPPSFEELERRLFKRKTEEPQERERRLKKAEYEMSMAVHYDYHVINDQLELTYQILRSILVAQEHKTH